MPVIITIVIAMFLIMISWSWNNLGNIAKSKKIVTITIALAFLYLITFIVFNISKQGVLYSSEEQMNSVRNMIVIIFTIINGLIILPSISKVIDEIDEETIDKEQAAKRFLIRIAIFLIILIFECIYLKNIQNDILNIYLNALHK